MKEKEDLKEAVEKLIKVIDENPCGMGKAMFWALALFVKELVKFLKRKRYLSVEEASAMLGVSPPLINSVSNSLKAWAKKAEIKKNVSFHVSRHTFATSLLTKGADLYTVSKLMGHKDIGVTQIYAEIVNQKRVEAIKLLDE